MMAVGQLFTAGPILALLHVKCARGATAKTSVSDRTTCTSKHSQGLICRVSSTLWQCSHAVRCNEGVQSQQQQQQQQQRHTDILCRQV